ncbi:plasmid mobilization relaxosome protein MobC [Kocuria sp. CPCC 205258]|uniref:plasmid mobilization relaxosome protein MobC n=1 Tax=Kocuria sp. CPCC 205258 TaxID=3073552 RepID=UPI0034D764FE
MAKEQSKSHLWHSRRRNIEGATQYVRVSMSEKERAQLMVLEQQTGLSPSAILVDAALGTGDPTSLMLRKQELATLLELRRLVATIANNVNQITRHANATGELAAETTATVAEARRIGQEILTVLEEIKP